MLDEEHAHVALVGEPPDEARQLGALASRRARRRARRASRPTAPTPPFGRCRRAGAGRTGAPRGSGRGAARARTRAPRPPRSDGRSWWPGQKRSVTHDSREARWSLPARMFSSTLMSSNSSSDWNERRSPSRARLRRVQPSMRRSSSAIDPPLTGTKPVTASMRVVFPAPFGPIRPTTSPGRTSIDTSSTATTEPKRTVRPVDRQRRARHRLDRRPAEGAARSGRRATRWSFSHSGRGVRRRRRRCRSGGR